MDIRIRHAEPADAPAVHQMLVGGHTVAGTMRLPYAPLSSTEERLAPQDGRVTLVAVEGGEVAGFAELVTHQWPRHNHVGDLNMVVTDAERQGHGVGRSLVGAVVELADDWLHLVRLQLFVWADNAHAIRLHESFGFVVEGTLTAFTRGRGGYVDALVMGRVRAPVSLDDPPPP